MAPTTHAAPSRPSVRRKRWQVCCRLSEEQLEAYNAAKRHAARSLGFAPTDQQVLDKAIEEFCTKMRIEYPRIPRNLRRARRAT